jgi:hypothetical protein
VQQTLSTMAASIRTPASRKRPLWGDGMSLAPYASLPAARSTQNSRPRVKESGYLELPEIFIARAKSEQLGKSLVGITVGRLDNRLVLRTLTAGILARLVWGRPELSSQWLLEAMRNTVSQGFKFLT